MQKIKLIFGYNNIVKRTFSKNEIKNSRILYGLDTLLDGERLWILLINLSFIIAIPYFSVYADHFLEQLKYIFIHSFFAIFLLEDCSFTWILMLLLLPSRAIFWFALFWATMIVLCSLAFSLPYLLIVILLVNFYKFQQKA